MQQRVVCIVFRRLTSRCLQLLRIGSALCRLQGSEVDIEEESAGQSRPGLLVLARRARQHFRRPCILSDKDSAELWNSSQAGCQILWCCAHRHGPA